MDMDKFTRQFPENPHWRVGAILLVIAGEAELGIQAIYKSEGGGDGIGFEQGAQGGKVGFPILGVRAVILAGQDAAGADAPLLRGSDAGIGGWEGDGGLPRARG